MRAILLAAGYGTRLRPLTNRIPKCLVPINGKPLLQIWLERLVEAGNEYFLINTHYLSSQVEEFVQSSDFSNKITLTYEPELLGTAGTLLANIDFFQEQDGLLIHADNYCMADIREFMQAHHERPSDCIMTMMTFHTNDPTSSGIVELNPKDVVVNFHEKITNPPGNIANGAIYILSAAMLDELKQIKASVSDFSTEVIPQFLGRIYAYQTTKKFLDIGTLENYYSLTINS